MSVPTPTMAWGTARRTAATLRESAQQEADDVRLTGLAGLRELRQQQADAGKGEAGADGDDNVVDADYEEVKDDDRKRSA